MRYVLYFPKAGFINDPLLATQNIQSRQQNAMARNFTWANGWCRLNRRTAGSAAVTLDCGATLEAPVVVNASGPHSYKINEMAGVLDGYEHQDQSAAGRGGACSVTGRI